MNILVRGYVEDGYQPIPPIRLSDEAYGEALQCFVPACTDVLPIDREKKVIYLAKRAAKPMAGWWWIGGRMVAQEAKETSAVRCFERETSVALEETRLQLVTVFDYRWKDRAQTPEDLGCHMLGYLYVVELTDDERTHASSHLETKEYEAGIGLVAFTRAQLLEAGVFPAIVDAYDHIFGPATV